MQKFSSLCVLIFMVCASPLSLAQDRDCSGPLVRLGELKAGLHAGFTGGTINDITLPSGFFLNTFIVEQRGFIDPESGRGWKCDADWGLVSGWAGFRIGDGGLVTRTELLKTLETLIDVEIEIDYVQHVIEESRAKWMVKPQRFGQTTQALKAFGAFLEPYSLEPGPHHAKVTFSVDLDCLPDFGGVCDGIPDFVDTFESDFEVLSE